MHKRVRADRAALLDARAMQDLIRNAVADQYDGDFSVALKATNEKGRPRGVTLNQSSLWRLMNGKIESIAASTIRWLLLLVPAPEHPRLRATLTAPQVLVALRAHNAWVAEQTRPVQPRLQDDWSVAREFGRVLKVMRELAPAAFNAFKDGPGRVHSAERVRLAYWRVAERLMVHEASAGIERSWRELDGAEMRKYAEAALRCEHILLRRGPDFQRAQRAVGSDAVASDMRRWLDDER
jgi:hypothetical protein